MGSFVPFVGLLTLPRFTEVPSKAGDVRLRLECG